MPTIHHRTVGREDLLPGPGGRDAAHRRRTDGPVRLIFMVGAVTEFAQPVNPTVWRRYLSVMLDGLRTEGLHRDALPLPPLSSEELHEAKQCLKDRRR